MLDGMERDLEEQIARLFDEAEKPMRAEEILPHLHPVMPSANDIADVLGRLADKGRLRRDGSYFARERPPPLEMLFSNVSPAQREAAETIVDIIRTLDERSGEGASLRAVVSAAQKRGIPRDRVLDVLTMLRESGEAYSVGGDRLRLAAG